MENIISTELKWFTLKKIPAMLSPKYLTFAFLKQKQAPLLKLILRKQSKFLMIRLAAGIISLFCYIFLIGKIMKLYDM